KRKQPSLDETSHMGHYPPESDEGRDSLMVISPCRLKMIDEFMTANRFSLLRSPPYTGKTTLGVVLRDYFLALNHKAVYISLAGMAGKETRFNENLFQHYWKERVGHTWDEIIRWTEPTEIIIDEAQIIYGDCAPFFWGDLKELMSTPWENITLRVLLLATYDPALNSQPSPVHFTNTLGLDALRITSDEFERLVATFVERRRALGNEAFGIPTPVKKAIFNLANGHADLCRFALTSMHHMFRDNDSDSAVNMLRYLASSHFRTALQCTRAFVWTQNWSPTVQESEFLSKIFLSCDSESFCNVGVDSNPVAKSFFKLGLLTTINHRSLFTAPIMRIVLGHCLFTVSGGSKSSPAITFDEFVMRTIERMKPSILSKSLGRGTDQESYLLERTWQMEWYRAATSAVPVNATVSPDVGGVFGSVGFLDFYVDGDLCWGVELLREGDRMKEHRKRFAQDGEYKNIPLKEWVIIDFRHQSKPITS
ncbi:4396_t:CDS:1, partial [Paraglomus occultum]